MQKLAISYPLKQFNDVQYRFYTVTMSSPRYFTLIWKFFSLFAVYPLSKPHVIATSSVVGHLYWFIWRCVLFTIICLLSSYIFLERESILHNMDTSGSVNDLLKYSSLLLTSLVVIIETFVKRSCHDKIWKIMARIKQSGQFDDIDRQHMKQFSITLCVLADFHWR
jgi:hypothetical protein